MNIWKNITAAQIAYDLIHQKNPNREIINYNPLCIIYIRDNKSRTRNYKNFLIYLTNYYYLTDINETNLTFEKLSRKLKILLQNENSTDRKIVKSIQKNAKDIFKTIRLSRNLKISFKNIVSIVIGIVYRIEIFES